MSLPASVTLRDGTRVTLRPIRPDDAAALRAMFHRLSAESRYQRFFAVFSDLSPAMLRYLTEVDGDDHLAIVAVVPGDDGERIVGVARAVREAGRRDVAEAAFTVADDVQRKGLGTRLLAELASAARTRGVRRFRLEVKHDNAGMRRLAAEAGGTVVSADGAEVLLDVELCRSPARILLQLIATQTRAFFALLAPSDRTAA
ncbi:MAG: GNAT family N-acetyltransferase [Minicystis sp.]